MKIRVESLSRSYASGERNLTVIENLSFDFPEHRTVAIVGKSGTGKSTLLHMLGGLDRPTRGKVWFGDECISELDPERLAEFRAKNVGFIFQFHHLLPEFTALENAAMPLVIRGLSAAAAEKAAGEILEKVGLSGRMTHRPSELSGGEQQRVAIARALVTKPTAILADEPTGNLDLYTAQEVQKLLLDLNRQLETTLIVVTHNNDLAAGLDCVLEMGPGGTLTVARTI